MIVNLMGFFKCFTDIATQGYHQDVPSTQLLRQSMHHDDNESILSDHTDQEVVSCLPVDLVN